MKGTIGSAAMTAAILAVSPVAAQQNDNLTRGDIENFFDRIESQYNQALQQGDKRKIAQFARDHLIDYAHWSVNGMTFVGNERISTTQSTFDPQTLETLAFSLGNGGMDMVRDANLEAELRGIKQTEDPNEAMVLARWTMNGTAKTAGNQEGLGFENEATCEHLLKKHRGQIKVSFSSCDARMRFDRPQMAAREWRSEYRNQGDRQASIRLKRDGY